MTAGARNVLPVLRYSLAGLLIFGSVVGAVSGASWFSVLGGFIVGFMLILWFGRLFGVGVSRKPDEIVCRYVPWYESNAYIGCLLVPLAGLSALAKGNAGDTIRNPGLMKFAGVVLLSATPVLFWGAARQWHRCRLKIDRSALTVGVIKPGPTPMVISRANVDAIGTESVAPGAQGIFKVQQVAIVYRSADAGAAVNTIQIGPKVASVKSGLQLSVKSRNLDRALRVWKDGSFDDPELLDRVEALLRG